MNNTLFNPNRLDLPSNLVLVPQFWSKPYYESLKQKAGACIDMVGSDILIFDDYAVIVGFLGYPAILTLLEFISDVRDKNIYFLGTAGSMNETYNSPVPLAVESVYSTELLDHFCEEKSFSLRVPDTWDLERVKGVTVDIIQRETAQWLKRERERGMDFVEMELFPLRAYLGKSFSAIVVTSDLLKESGIQVFRDRKLLIKEFLNSYELIVKTLL